MQNPIISNIWTVSRCVSEAVEGEKREVYGSFSDEGGWAVFIAGELITAETWQLQSVPSAAQRARARVPLIQPLSWGSFLWDIGMDSLICCFQGLIITVSSLDNFPLPVTLLNGGVRSNYNRSLFILKRRCAPGLAQNTTVLQNSIGCV